jgi:hypothetical protein
MQLLLLVLVLMAVYFWAKSSYFKADLSQKVEAFPSRGAPLVKRSRLQTPAKRVVHEYAVGRVESVQQNNHALSTVEELQKSVQSESLKSIALRIPEDSVLRRHFMTQLRAEIALKMGEKPTDFSLARHYEAKLQTEIAKIIAADS